MNEVGTTSTIRVPMNLFPATLSLIVILTLVGITEPAMAQTYSRIYGVIHTTDGEDFEGYIRWDKNEVGWDNILDGTKTRRRVGNRRSKRRRNRESWFGRFFDASFVSSRSAQSGVRFGNIERLEPDGDNSVIVTLKGGDEIELRRGSTDIGTDIREILIEDASKGEVELYWDDIESVRLFASPARPNSRHSESVQRGEIQRIYGTVTTRRRDEFTGFIGWDYDESLTSDILDGYVSGRKRKVRFGSIASIERRGSDGSIVITRDGKKIRMEDSNDVDDRNNGIAISDPSLGRIVIRWDDFDRLEITSPPEGRPYESYAEASQLRGVVTTEEDDTFTGEIVWDADEEFNWELLDGEYRDASFAIVFENIASIEKSRRGAKVILRDGREFRLRDSNDIDRSNKGIFVMLDNGEYEEISWDDFFKVEFND